MDRLEKNARIKVKCAETRLRRNSQSPLTIDIKVDESHLSARQRDQIDGLFLEGKRYINTMINFVENGGNIEDFPRHSCTEVLIKDQDGKIRKEPIKYLKTSQKDAYRDHVKAAMKAMTTLRARGYQKNDGMLKYKSVCRMVPFMQMNTTHRFYSACSLKLQRIKGRVRIRGLERFYNRKGMEFANGKLVRLADGLHFFLTAFIPKEEAAVNKLPLEKKPTIGVDFGCTHSLNLSNGEVVEIKVEESERTKREQRNLLRKVKGSNAYNKNRLRLQRAYLKTTYRKKDMANKAIHELRKHELVVFQDEQLKGWQKGGHGKAVQHSAMGRIKDALKASPNAVMLSRFIPTTKFCTHCGQNMEVSRFDKTVTCCGVTEQRDLHAAKAMLWIATELFHIGFLPTGRREITRAEFDEALKSFDFNAIQTMKHEAARSLVAR